MVMLYDILELCGYLLILHICNISWLKFIFNLSFGIIASKKSDIYNHIISQSLYSPWDHAHWPFWAFEDRNSCNASVKSQSLPAMNVLRLFYFSKLNHRISEKFYSSSLDQCNDATLDGLMCENLILRLFSGILL